jgi:hypothetical protein
MGVVYLAEQLEPALFSAGEFLLPHLADHAQFAFHRTQTDTQSLGDFGVFMPFHAEERDFSRLLVRKPADRPRQAVVKFGGELGSRSVRRQRVGSVVIGRGVSGRIAAALGRRCNLARASGSSRSK